MPTHYRERLSRDELDDLVNYLVNGGAPRKKPPASRGMTMNMRTISDDDLREIPFYPTARSTAWQDHGLKSYDQTSRADQATGEFADLEGKDCFLLHFIPSVNIKGETEWAATLDEISLAGSRR
jgi:hypothetical protein